MQAKTGVVPSAHGHPLPFLRYARILLNEVCVADREIRISGYKAVLARSAAGGVAKTMPAVLSFVREWFCSRMVRPTGFEPMAPRLGIWCSILLSYGRPRLL